MVSLRCIYCQHTDSYEEDATVCKKCGHVDKLTTWVTLPTMRTKAASLPFNGFNRGIEHLDRDLDILDGKGTA